jgi:hypothetical protein
MTEVSQQQIKSEATQNHSQPTVDSHNNSASEPFTQNDLLGEASLQTIAGQPAHVEKTQLDYDIEKTQGALQDVFPDKKFELFSKEGSGGIIFVDPEQPDIVYKVARNNDALAYEVQEAEFLKKLGESGLGPKLIQYIHPKEPQDAFSLMIRQLRNQPTELPQIADKNLRSDLPIIVMEKVDFVEVEILVLEEDFILAEADRIAHKLDEIGLDPGDIQYVLDKKTERLKIIDAGGFSLKKEGKTVTSQDVLKGLRHDIQIAKYKQDNGIA